jgi:glucose-1-phosphate adenylyltransferase
VVPRRKILTLILAGGKGSRLEVLTEVRAKPALPFAGTYRLIDFALSNCMHSGLSDVWVIEQYQPHDLNEHLANGRPWDLDRTYGGLQVLPPFQGSDEEGFAQGNADAIYRHKVFIRQFEPDLILVLSADHVYRLNYQDVIDSHLERAADVTAVTTRVPLEEAGRFGTVRVDEKGRLTEFAYKPETPQSDLVTTEVFVYDARALLETLDALAGAGDGGEPALKDFGHELLPRLVGEGRAYEYPLEGYWKDVGVVESYWGSHMDLLAPEPGLTLDDPDWPILTYGAQRLPARIHGSARVDNSLISPGCVVRGEVRNSVLAPGVIVEEGALVRETVLLQDVVVEAGSSVACAILDAEVRVGKGAAVGAAREGLEAPRCSGADLALVGRRIQIPARGHVEAGARLKPEGSKGS